MQRGVSRRISNQDKSWTYCPLIVFKFYVYIFLISITACDSNENVHQRRPPPLFPSPTTFPLKTGEGYVINPVSGDSIQPIINNLGDTVITGVPIMIQGRKISADLATIKRLKPNPPLVRKGVEKGFQIPSNPKSIPFEVDSSIKFSLDSDHASFILLNVLGDTLPTGIPIPAKGKQMHCQSPNPVDASLPVFKDASIYNIKYLDVDQGLNSSRIWSIMFDRRGKLWCGTHAGGVSMYDGEKFHIYTTNEGLLDNIITCVLEDKKGNIWFGTWLYGITRYDGTHYTHFTSHESLSRHVIRAMMEDRDGNIWIGSEGGGVSKFDGKNFTHYTTKEGLTNNSVQCMVQDNHGDMWFGTLGGGVNIFDGQSFTQVTTNDGLSGNSIFSIYKDSHGNLWFGMENGICKYDGKQIFQYSIKEGTGSVSIISILEDQNGMLWFGSTSGLFQFNGESFRHLTAREGLSDNTITSLMEDRHGSVWLATRDGGVNIIDRSSLRHFAELEEISGNNVRSILEDDAGSYWLASWGGGVIRYDGQHLYQYRDQEGINDNTVWSILKDQDGNLWFGTGRGICKFDGFELTQFLELPGIPRFGVLSMVEDRNGHLWLGTLREGIIRYDGASFTQYSSQEGFPGDQVIWSIIEDKQGNIWAATWGGGVCKFDGENFTFYTEKEGLSNNSVWSILEDHNGHFWFGTYGGGLNIFDGEKFTYLTTEEGLPNNIVSSILEDQSGNIWMGTEKGLSQTSINPNFDPTSTDQTSLGDYISKIHNYSRYDGLDAVDFNVHSTYLDMENRLWLGTGKSLVRLDLDHFQIATRPPILSMDQVYVAGNFKDYHKKNDNTLENISFDDVDPFSNLPVNLTLAPNLNHLTFQFSAINGSKPHHVLYSYRIKELNPQWSIPSRESKAEYRNLPYGSYTFMVCASGESKEWSDPVEYNFTILTPWWHSLWARILCLVFGVLLMLGVIRWRTAHLKRRQKELELTIADRTAEVVAQQKRSDELLLNILPVQVAEELKDTGHTQPVHYEEVSILFADFKEFTHIVASIPGKKLVAELDDIFQHFDDIMLEVGLEKIQTIGDAYVAAGGLPREDPDHAVKCVKAGKQMIKYLDKRNKLSSIKWKLRVGIHSGPITAGVVGKRKFTYDVFGDTVNIAARIESASEEGRINVSAYTRDLIKNNFSCEYRGKINAKGKGDLDMYFVE